MIRKTLFTLLIITQVFTCFSQAPKKKLNALRINEAIEINGDLSELIWGNAEVATDFIQLEPYNGNNSDYKSVVKILYTDYAIYIGAELYDLYPDSIMKQLSRRDAIGQSDFFGISIDPFKNGLTGYTFIVTPSNVQFDARQSGYEDSSWDAVWVSKALVNKKGWTVEMEIPYSELRFPKKNVQEWGLNFVRNVQRSREKSFWNYVDASIDGFLRQAGELSGIQDVSPPIRLSFTPYVSGYILDQAGSNGLDYDLRGGLDLKYGINESYTLDMMLIPDFGQVESDDKILNISAFETYYDEKRAFFTEGTELFDKGEIFYSRRIGSVKSERRDADFGLYENEEVTLNPSETSLINVTKITGRGTNGLGIGFLNGVSYLAHATIQDTLTGAKRKVISQPYTNYNVLVVDKSLKNNSYISFTNTNYLQPEINYMSNVAATDMHFETKNGNYAAEAIFGVSYIDDINQTDSTGMKYEVEFEKISGKFRFGIQQSLATKSFNQNDMGYLSKTDELETEASVAYNIYDPFWRVLRWYNNVDYTQYSLFSHRKSIGDMLSFRSFTTFKNYLSINLSGEFTLGGYNEFYEPRVDGRVLKMPGFWELSTFLSPDYRKKFVTDVSLSFSRSYTDNMWSLNTGIMPIVRFNDKLNLNLGAHYNVDKNQLGFVDKTDANDTIYFGSRNVNTLINSLNVNYNFSADMAISLRARHYWRVVDYFNYYLLNLDGSLTPNNDYSTDDINSNFFNIDLMYTWRFAPGSELSVVWKNAIENNASDAVFNYYTNLTNLLDFDKQNSVSIRVLYYIDYFKISQKFKAI